MWEYLMFVVHHLLDSVFNRDPHQLILHEHDRLVYMIIDIQQAAARIDTLIDEFGENATRRLRNQFVRLYTYTDRLFLFLQQPDDILVHYNDDPIVLTFPNGGAHT